MTKKMYAGAMITAALLILSLGSKTALAEGELQGGLSIDDAQNMICDGTYGGREWSTSQQHTACQRVGRNMDNSFMPVHPLIVVFSASLLVAVIGYVFYRYKNKRKFKKLATKKARQK